VHKISAIERQRTAERRRVWTGSALGAKTKAPARRGMAWRGRARRGRAREVTNATSIHQPPTRLGPSRWIQFPHAQSAAHVASESSRCVRAAIRGIPVQVIRRRSLTQRFALYFRTCRQLAIVVCSLLTAGCATTDWAPVNGPLDRPINTERFSHEVPSSDDGLVIGLSFSGGGTRAAAFAYGVLDALQAPYASSSGTPLLAKVKFISGVSGGSVTAAYYGLFHDRIFQDFEQKFLYANAEADLRTTLGPGVITAAFSGGINDQTRLPRWLQKNLFGSATVNDLLEGTPRVVLNASDIYNRVPFAFTLQTFNAICSDPTSVLAADAVAASSAVPIAFVPIVMQVYKEKCKGPLPSWASAAARNPAAAAKIRATASAWVKYRDDPEVGFLKLADGGITDNFGLSSLSISLEALNGPEKLIDLVRIRRVVFLVVDAGQEQTAAWTQTAGGSSGIDLAVAAINTGMSSSARTNFDLFVQLMKRWKQDAIAARCHMDRSDIAKYTDLRPGWRCTDLEVIVSHLSFDDLGPERARQLSKVPTRLSLPGDQVSAVIQAGRDVVRMPWVLRARTALR
jgi:NTE family protein